MSAIGRIKRALVGKPIASKHAHHERLRKRYGLPVFASDALSSVAYASEEILHVLVVAGIAGFVLLTPISMSLGVLMLIVAFSYYQTIQAYPKGGGTYLVSTENLGSMPGRVAGASLLIDYTLTVAVSISSGVAAVVSAFPDQPWLAENMVLLGCIAVAIVMVINLRGTRESGVVFAIPTYTFVVSILILIVSATIAGWGKPDTPPTFHHPEEPLQAVTLILVLRAFAASCTALTGTEAIADGVPAFREPAAKNAGMTLIMMVVLLLTMFVGISYTAQHFGITPMESGTDGFQTVLAQIAVKQFGVGPMFYLLQAATALILVLAANTAFADFPRLASFLAKDGYLPRQLASLGDRLVYQNGIILLALVAMGLIVVFKGDTHSLVPLYAMGVFISFTLSQAGMFVKSRREGFPAWKGGVSLFGAITTGVVTLILAVTKFEEGAWLIVVALAILLTVFWGIRGHYNYLADELNVPLDEKIKPSKTTVLLLVPRVHRGVMQALSYAQSLTRDVRAIHVTLNPEQAKNIKDEWMAHEIEMPLVILESPYRSFIEPIIEYVDQTLEEEPDSFVTVIVPQAIPKHWYHSLLHNNVAVPLKLALGARKNVVVTNVRYFLQ
ncbi:MAG: APC family permease [Fimbriimonadaceae bacterium]